MIADKNRVFDGWMTLEGGVDAGRLPYTLDPNQCVSATNVSFRGGSMSTRPGFRKIVEILPPIVRLPDNPFGSRDIHTEAQYWCYNSPYKTSTLDRIEGEYANAYTNEVPYTELHDFPYYEVPANLTGENSEYIYKHGIFQCAQAYSPHNGEDCIMALIGGRLFRIVPGPTTAQVRELPIHGEDRDLRNDRNSPIGYMCQADKWHIAQDGKSNAIIYDNATARRSKTAVDINHTEIPTGTIMAYGMGRLVVIVNGRDVAFGDLNGSHDLPDPADSLILFTERNFLAEGFDAAIPFTQGLATGMIFFPQLDTSTGNGQLMVFAERGATSFFMSLPREQWKTSSFQILALLTTGMRGHRSIAVVNEDLWFRSDDGVRSYRQARSEQSGWAHIPLSTNVKQFLKNDTDYLLKYCSGIYFDNRVIMTTSPMWNNGRPIHWGAVVVDFDIISSFSGAPTVGGQLSKPAWEGQWLSTQFLPIQFLTGIFNGVTRAFVFGMDSNAENQLYELSVDDKDDFDDTKINWEMVSRSFDFNKLNPQDSTVFTENELYDGDIWLKDVVE